MVVDFAKVSVQEQPLIILQNLDDTPIGVLKAAFNVEAELCYNEISTLTFDLPAYIEGEETEKYERVVGMRIVELKDYGRFLLLDPKIDDDGVKEIKTCTAYSLEYEFTFKKMPLSAGTYNLWNPFAPDGTILGMILEMMPSWRVGNVDATLIDKYRTFDDSADQNIYNFMKSDLQESYGCIFTFDTYDRIIHVRDIMTEAPIVPVFFSMENLVKNVSIDEDTESIVTSLEMSGADGVDIRSVNPMGTNNIIDLGYFMNPDNFSQAMIDKYENWKETFESYQRQYFNLTVEEALKTAQLVTEQAALTTLQGELTSLENIQAVTIQAIAQKLKTQSDLNEVNRQITDKKKEITAKEKEIKAIEVEVTGLNNQMLDINKKTNIKRFFTENEYKILNRYMKEEAVSEDSFVVPKVDTYDAAGESVKLSGAIFNITNATVTKVANQFGKDIYSVSGGTISCSTSGFVLQANVVRASLDFDSDSQLLFTARLNKGTFNDTEFPSACISLSGAGSAVTSNAVPDSSVHGAIAEGSTLSFKIGNASLYFTRSTTEYEQRSVEWDLFDYGKSLLEKVAWPSYSFSLDIVNFLALTEFEPFKNKMELGSKLYWKQRNGKVLKPILIRVRIPFEDLTKFEIGLSSKYNSSEAEFCYDDLIEDGVTAGKTIDSGKWTYNQFVNSGAETSLGKFIKSALDIAKNNIISSTGQDISWTESGLRFRKKKDGSTTEYDPYQIWINNGSIMFTTDNWDTANLAIGQIVSDSGNVLSGVIADYLIGKITATNNLIVECIKEDGGEMVFRADSSGVSLHNATFDIYNSSNTQITLNPYSGIAIGKYPLYSGDKYTINENNAKFWVDTSGNVHLKGTLHGVDGTFTGKLQAASGDFKGTVQAAAYLDRYGRPMLTADYKFAADYLELKGLNVNNNFIVDSNGNVTVRGAIQMGRGSYIEWPYVNETGSAAYQTAINAEVLADDAYYEASRAAANLRKLANGQYSGTFIDGRMLISPEIYTNLLTITTPDNNNVESGLLLTGYYDRREYDWLKIYYWQGDYPILHFDSPGGASAYWDFGNTHFTGWVDFSTATVTGLEATFA